MEYLQELIDVIISHVTVRATGDYSPEVTYEFLTNQWTNLSSLLRKYYPKKKHWKLASLYCCFSKR
jgi:hypothetical protein